MSALQSFLRPQSVAVIGASRNPDSIGGRVIANLVGTGFKGPIYPVNPAGGELLGLPVHRSVTDIPGPVELAVVVVPKEAVGAVARESAAKGVRSLVVISSGFSETGAEGARRQAELLDICRGAGMRLIGPNCMGIVNTDPVVLNASFGPIFPPAGGSSSPRAAPSAWP